MEHKIFSIKRRNGNRIKVVVAQLIPRALDQGANRAWGLVLGLLFSSSPKPSHPPPENGAANMLKHSIKITCP